MYLKFSAASNDSAIFTRLRKAGTDATGSNYFYGGVGFSASQATFNVGTNPTTDGFFLQDTDSGSSIKPTFGKVEFLNPKLNEFTSVFSQCIGSTTAGVTVSHYGGGNHNVQDTYDSATIRIAAGTMTGTLTLYGVNK